jgi:hypothetical protein
MNFKTIVAAALVIGSSSLAFAEPQGGVEVSNRQREDVRDHRDLIQQPAPRPASWNRPPILMTLATTKLVNGRDTIRFAGAKSLSAIKLEATRGRTQVSEVKIKFANGQSQIVYPNKLLTGTSCIDIDLQGNVRNVTGITVFGSANMRSSFEVLGA